MGIQLKISFISEMGLLFLLLPLVVVTQGTTLDKCCPEAKVDGMNFVLSYPNNTNVPENSCDSSCPYLLEGAEDSSDVRCLDTVNNEDLCVIPRLQTRKRNKPIDSATKQTRDRSGKKCGYVYEHSWYRGSWGYVGVTRGANFFRKYNDMISSVLMKTGCTMQLFQHTNQRGRSKTFTANSGWVGSRWNDKFSSVKCTC